jgi:hypothetical protein
VIRTAGILPGKVLLNMGSQAKIIDHMRKLAALIENQPHNRMTRNGL